MSMRNESTDHYMEPAQHGVQDVLNNSTEVHVFHRTRLDLDHARLEKDHVRLEKDHARLEKDHVRLEKDHARLEKDHVRLEKDHARLEKDHVRLEKDHARLEKDHVRLEKDHARLEKDHVRLEKDHARLEKDHVRLEKDHARLEKDHVRLEKDHARLEKDHVRLEKDHARLEKDHVRLEKDHARLEKDHVRLEKDHARLEKDHVRLDLDHEVSQNDRDLLKRNPGGVVEEKPCWLKRNPALGQMFGLLKKSNLQQDVYFPFKTVLEKEQMIFGNKKQFASNEFDFVQKQRNQRKRQNKFDDDEKWIRSGDCPFTKAKRSNRDVSDPNELQTYAILEKMLHKAIHLNSEKSPFQWTYAAQGTHANPRFCLSPPSEHLYKEGSMCSVSGFDVTGATTTSSSLILQRP
uniref:Uncharacterized protein n=1 Tax=Brassica oleracea var. oleracea TaxID=109376 RepID=A0A0D3DNF2_BRAOL